MNKKDYKNGLLWFVEALTLLDKQDDNYHTADRIDILKYYAYATFKQGQQENAISAMSSIVELMQNEETFYEHIISYQKNLTMVTDVEKKNKSIQQISRENVAKLMKSLCQGENLLVRIFVVKDRSVLLGATVCTYVQYVHHKKCF